MSRGFSARWASSFFFFFPLFPFLISFSSSKDWLGQMCGPGRALSSPFLIFPFLYLGSVGPSTWAWLGLSFSFNLSSFLFPYLILFLFFPSSLIGSSVWALGYFFLFLSFHFLFLSLIELGLAKTRTELESY